MSLPRYAAARDAGEAAIIRALRTLGATVHQLNDKGLPDLLVGYRHQNFLLEVKAPRPAGSKAQSDLTEAQREFFAVWAGRAAVVRSVADALEAVGAIWSHEGEMKH